jgi:hypothetical protein
VALAVANPLVGSFSFGSGSNNGGLIKETCPRCHGLGIVLVNIAVQGSLVAGVRCPVVCFCVHYTNFCISIIAGVVSQSSTSASAFSLASSLATATSQS